jgi:hypothetical protein
MLERKQGHKKKLDSQILSKQVKIKICRVEMLLVVQVAAAAVGCSKEWRHLRTEEAESQEN